MGNCGQFVKHLTQVIRGKKEKNPGGYLGILGGGVPPGFSNPDPISDQKMSFSTPVFRPDL